MSHIKVCWENAASWFFGKFNRNSWKFHFILSRRYARYIEQNVMFVHYIRHRISRFRNWFTEMYFFKYLDKITFCFWKVISKVISESVKKTFQNQLPKRLSQKKFKCV